MWTSLLPHILDNAIFVRSSQYFCVYIIPMHSATWINFTLIVDQKCNLRLLFSIVVNNDVWQCGAKKNPCIWTDNQRKAQSLLHVVSMVLTRLWQTWVCNSNGKSEILNVKYQWRTFAFPKSSEKCAKCIVCHWGENRKINKVSKWSLFNYE